MNDVAGMLIPLQRAAAKQATEVKRLTVATLIENAVNVAHSVRATMRLPLRELAP